MVKLAVSVILAAALASSVYAQDLSSFDEGVFTREIAPSAEQDLFGRAAVNVMSDLFSREELGEIFGRDVEDISQRDIEELFQREVTLDKITDLIARQEAVTPEKTAVESGNPPAPTATDAPKDKSASNGSGDGKKDCDGKKHLSIGGRFLRWLRHLFLGSKKDDKENCECKDSGAETTKPERKRKIKKEGDTPEPAAPAEAPTPEGREFLEEPVERRAFDMEAIVKNIVARYYEDPEGFATRDWEGLALDVFRRAPEFESEVYERDLEEPDFEARQYADELNASLFRRASETFSQLEELD